MKCAYQLLTAFFALAILCCGSRSTPKPLIVLSFSPDKTTDQPEQPIRIQFGSPAVSAEQVSLVLQQTPVQISPFVPHSARWEDRQTLVILPLAALVPATRYTVRLRGELGERASNREFSFLYRPLEVRQLLGIEPLAVAPQLSFAITFNLKVRGAQAVEHCRIEDNATGQFIALVTPDPNHVGEEIALQASAPLDRDRGYKLICEGLPAEGGNEPMPARFEQALRVYPLLALKTFSPQGRDVSCDEVRVALDFTTPVSAEELRRAIAIEPAVSGFLAFSGGDDNSQLRAELDLKPQTDYRVRVASSLTDVYGQKLGKESVFSFRTGDARSRLEMETGIFAVEAAAPSYPVWTRNVSTFDVECAVVPQGRLVALLTSDLNYDPWYDAGNQDQIRWKELKLGRKERRVRVKDAKNSWHLEQLDLGALCRGKTGQRGLYLAEVRSEDVLPQEGRESSFRPYKRVLANVTDLGVLLKAGSASGLVWVTRFSSGEPVSGAEVTVYTLKGRKAYTTTTDADGIARIPGADELLGQPGAGEKDAVEADPEEEYDTWRARRLIAVVRKEGDLAVVDGNWSNGIQTWNFGVPSDYEGGVERIRGFILSDRGIYRPGETVHFKGLVRRVAENKMPEVPRGAKTTVHVEDSRGATVLEKRLELSAFGGFAFDLELGAEASTGDYFVTATVDKQVFRERFFVEEFRKTNIEVDLATKKKSVRLGDLVDLQLQARYLFGAPLANASVSYSAMRRDHVLDFPRFPEHTFEDLAARGEWYWWDERADRYSDFVADGAGGTDQEGRFSFSIKDEAKNVERPQDYLIEARVQESTGETVTKRLAVTAHRAAMYVGLHAQEWIQAVGMPFAVNAVAVTPDGAQVESKATLSYVRAVPRCKYVGQRRVYESCETEYQKIWSREVTIPPAGQLTSRINPEQPGEYIVRLDAKDSRGNTVAASRYVWVLGKGEAFWSGDESARMALVPSKREYKPGDVARLVARSAFERATALVTVERNGVLEARVLRRHAMSEGIDIPITEPFAPNVFASVALVTGRTGEGDRLRPKFQMGVTELKVATEQRELRVEVQTERKTYEPKEQVNGKIRVLGKTGEPVRAEVALSVADEGVLLLIGYKTPNPMDAFYKPFGLGVDNATTLNRVARLNDPNDNDPDEGGDAPGASESKIRSKFVSSAFWAPALVTDSNGEARFSFEAADNLTAFRLMAVAADQGHRFGASESRITVTKPLLVKPLLPRYFNAGDEAQIGVNIHNLTQEDGEAEVAVKANGLLLKTSSAKVRVRAGRAETVRFGAAVREVASATVTFIARMNGREDAARLEIPVGLPRAVDRRTLSRGRTNGEVAIPVAWPSTALAEESRLELAVDRTGLAELRPALLSLIEYPYGCLEQTLSRFIPLLQVRELADAAKIEGLRGARLDKFIEAGVAKVLRHQHEDGHFSLWPGGETYPHLTVYAIYGLSEAKKAGVKVDGRAIDRGVEAIRGWANDAALSGDGEIATAAMATAVLAELGKPDYGLVSRLYEQRKRMPIYGRAFLLRGMALARRDDSRVPTLALELQDAVQRQDGQAFVREVGSHAMLGHFMSSNERSTAIALSALLVAAPSSPVIAELAEGLRAKQKQGGGWWSTQDNIYSLVALAEYARREGKGVANAAITLAGKKMTAVKLEGHAALTKEWKLSALAPGDLRIVADAPVRYAVRLVVVERDAGTQSVSRGFAVKRQYLSASTGKPIERLKVGELVRVRLEVTSDKDHTYTALVDPLPAGLEPVNTRLATEVQDGQNVTEEQGDRYGWWDNGWSYIELRDDRVMSFADNFQKGTLSFEYLARALTPGRFAAPPARAEAMYEPEVFGRTAADCISVFE